MMNSFKKRQHRSDRAFSWLLIPFFILTATHTEVAGNISSGAGFATAIRVGALVVLATLIILRFGAKIPANHWFIAYIICAYFIVINIPDFKLFAIMATVTIFSSTLLASLASNHLSNMFLFLIRTYLIFNIAGFLVSGVIYLATGTIIDLHGMVFFWSESRVGTMMGMARLSGFQIEPGSYSNVIYMSVLISGLLRRRMFGYLETIAIISTLFTLAAWAVIGFLMYTGVIIFEYVSSGSIKKRSFRWSMTGFAITLMIGALPLIFSQFSGNVYLEYFQERFSGESGQGSASFKQEAFEAWVSHLWYDMAFGKPMSNSFCDYCVSIQDLGTLLNFIYYFGIFASVLILVPFGIKILRNWGSIFVFSITPIIVSKFYFYDPLFWFLIGLGLFKKNIKYNKDKRLLK